MVRFFAAGLSVSTGSISPDYADVPTRLTDEAALIPAFGEELRVTSLVREDDIVSQGQPLLSLRADPQVQFVAPMAARVASIETKPGRRLTQLLLFREESGDRYSHDVANTAEDAERLRALMMATGLWHRLRSRPFGRMPGVHEKPSAIIVMAADTRPGAPSPAHAVKGREEALARGLAAITRIGAEKVFFCAASNAPINVDLPEGITRATVSRLHPAGLAGIQVHRLAPASLEARVFDIHVEDVADLGELLETGLVPETRMVTVTAPP